jgi:hypothetical protein
LRNSQRLANRLEGQLQGLQGSLDALLQGQVPITFTGYFGAGLALAAALVLALVLAAAPAPALASTPLAFSPGASAAAPELPVVAALARAFIVKDVWREWQEGFAGRPAIRELEER